MDDLITWLKARLDERVESAKWLADSGEHAFALADVEAKREILDWAEKSAKVAECLPESRYALGELGAYRTVLEALALPYVGHPEFREEWRSLSSGLSRSDTP